MKSEFVNPDLLFQPGPPQGFSTLATAQWHGNPEPIVRELLQNCLDAAEKAKRNKAEVWFTALDVPKYDIPGIASYQYHFEEAVHQRAFGTQGENEKQVIRRIKKVLKAPRIPVLYCRDNGVGLNPDRMSRLLTEGNTDKGQKGAGSYGIGHLTAFAASDLRYILYAGRYRDQKAETLRDVSSAHAILASCKTKNGGVGGRGYWLIVEQTLFDASPYPGQAPPLLARELDQLEETGSVIGIPGFNDFRCSDPMDAIARVAAKNFLVAIWQGKMRVRIRGQSEKAVDGRQGLLNVLAPEKKKKQAEQGGGWLSGAQAYQAWETLDQGRRFTLTSGAQVYFRPLPKDTVTTQSRVQLFRNGMWITNNADRLKPFDFNGVNPFSAVIMIEDGELCRLVRGAEGPEHRGLVRKRLNRNDNKRLLELLKQIASELRTEAGETEATREYTPTDFAMFPGQSQPQAEVVPPYRPRRPPSDSEGRSTTLQPTDDENGIDRSHKGKTRSRGRGAAPKPGRSLPGRFSVLGIRNSEGRIDTVRVVWQQGGRTNAAKGPLGIRMRVRSGSDETCDRPLAPEWLRLREIRHPDGITRPQTRDPCEVRLPRAHSEFTVALAHAVDDPNAIEIDFVQRRGRASGNHQRPKRSDASSRA